MFACTSLSPQAFCTDNVHGVIDVSPVIVQGSRVPEGFRVLGVLDCKALGLGFRVVRFRVQGLGFTV
jgi:hypothetical protein